MWHIYVHDISIIMAYGRYSEQVDGTCRNQHQSELGGTT